MQVIHSVTGETAQRGTYAWVSGPRPHWRYRVVERDVSMELLRHCTLYFHLLCGCAYKLLQLHLEGAVVAIVTCQLLNKVTQRPIITPKNLNQCFG